MPSHAIADLPDRAALSNELHARPFPELKAPGRAAHVAIMADGGPNRDGEAERDHLRALLDRFGAQHPAPDANHWSGPLGRAFLKWERHTEFMTYTLFAEGLGDRPFEGELFAHFPTDWLQQAPGRLLTSCLVRVEVATDDQEAKARVKNGLSTHFAAESFSKSHVLDSAATVMSDFRMQEGGHIRFAVLARPSTGPRRIGRIVQRLLEIETYKSASMLALPVARDVSGKVGQLDRELSDLVRGMSAQDGDDAAALDRLLSMSADIEALGADTAFRFGARGAYAAIVNQRIEVLRETRIGGGQTFAEFMMRRYEPAMRTCESAERRLVDLALRTERAANLLRTRVDVNLARQNAKLLESMNSRAALQLRLQETVEGLSIVAISYYAVGLAAYFFTPFGEMAGLGKAWLLALIAPVVVAGVWFALRRMRKRLEKGE
ncbi:DUF3422 family protein [Pontivivens insulae]|uniref:DUF3422 domain-containing protein n=1 Tax=Pontivivens insulae TaxID=1639689 RepID=A0A2R8A8R4_9RHOB|nr:DUF3422 domain-containing protein [Pontivivens insulae]RED18637.1 putative membrane-anchored protein [Pontivivens insulae]SPF28535.1 hypothetical protein POI8812_00836 [Pontivivens insulae]